MMTDRKRTAVRYAIAIDLVVIATGIALMLPRPALALGVFVLAVAGGALVAGSNGGFASTLFSLVALSVFAGRELALEHYVAFIVASGLTSLIVPLARDLVAGPAAAVQMPAATTVPPILGLAAPLLVLIIYTNASEIAVDTLGIPSPLQALLGLLAIALWYYRRAFQPGGIVMHPVTLLLAGYCAVLFASTVWATDLARADVAVTDAVKNLLIYIIVASLAISWNAIHRALATLLVAAALLSAVSIAQTTTGRTFGELGGFATIKIGDISGSSDLRASGPVQDPNFFAQILVLAIPIGFFLAWEEKRPRWRVLWFGLSTLVLAGTLATYSRGAMLALGVMAALLLLVLRVRPSRIAAIAVLALLLVAAGPANVRGRFMTLLPNAGSGEPDESIQLRSYLYGTAGRMFDEHLLFGIGAGNFSARFDEYANHVGLTIEEYWQVGAPRYTHMLYLELGAETGLAGLLTFLVAAVAACVSLRSAHRRLSARGERRHAALAIGLGLAIAAYLITSMFLHGYLMRYLWMLYGFAVALARVATTAPHAQEGAAA